MVAPIVEVTKLVGRLNVPCEDPAGIRREEGTCAVVELLLRVTRSPSVVAGPLRVMVPTEIAPPPTELGDNDNPVRAAVLIVRLLVTRVVPREAVTWATVVVLTGLVWPVNVALEVPAEIRTLEGPTQLLDAEANLTLRPPAGAIPDSLIVPDADKPPLTLLGAKDRV